MPLKTSSAAGRGIAAASSAAGRGIAAASTAPRRCGLSAKRFSPGEVELYFQPAVGTADAVSPRLTRPDKNPERRGSTSPAANGRRCSLS